MPIFSFPWPIQEYLTECRLNLLINKGKGENYGKTR